MFMYSYKAMDDNGRIFSGQMEARHLLDLESRLRQQQLDLIRGKQKKASLLSFRRAKPSRKDLINFCFYLEQLNSAGVPLIDALKDLRDSLEKSAFQEVVASVIEKIEGGETFSQALEHFPTVFGNSFVSLIRAGEESGKVGSVLIDLTESLKWQDELAAQTKKAMTYPIIMGVVVIGVVFFLMVYLVPQLVEFITSMEGELPIYTRVLIVVSNFFVNFWYLLIGIPAMALVGLKIALKYSTRARYLIDLGKLRIPVLGKIFEKLILAKFASYFALQFSSGITVLRCMAICEKIVDNTYIERALFDAGQLVSHGKSIHESLLSTRIFPPLVVRMIRVGEHSGDLEKSLINVSYFYKREVDESIEKLQSMIEPVMNGVMGFLIAWIMLSVMGPIYDLMATIEF